MKRLIVSVLVFAVLLSVTAYSTVAEDSIPFAFGDCNEDGKINLADVTTMLKYVARWNTPINWVAGDVNRDGDVTLRDAIHLLKYIAGWNVTLGEGGGAIGIDYSFPEMDFGGEELKILYYGKTATDYYDEYICVDENIWGGAESGSVIAEFTVARNKKVEQEYNVKITAEECGPIGEAVKRQMAGQCDFDLIYEWGTRSAGAALDGYLYDQKVLDDIHMINLDRTYWLPWVNDGLTVGGKLFVSANMISMNAVAYTETIFFNKNIMADIGEDFMNPYGYVEDGTWTYDKLIELALAAEKDVNHNGVFDNRDRFGGIDGDDILTAMCDDPYVEMNPDGSYSFVPYTESMVDMYQRLSHKTRSLESVPVDIPGGTGSPYYSEKKAAAIRENFKEGHTLFMKGVVDNMKEFADMKDDYGILPMPAKEKGGEYICRGDAMAPMFSIPTSISNPEMAIVIDYMAYMSSKYLYSGYKETTIHTKRVHDDRDYTMLNCIVDGIDMRWTDIYMFGTEADNLHRKMLSTGDFASVAKRYGVKCEEEVREVTNRIASVD